MIDVKCFYRELYHDMNEVLKPHGFRKKDCNYQLIRKNGVAFIINVQKSEHCTRDMSRFTVNYSVCILDRPPDKRNKDAEFPKQTYINLGSSETDDHQHWYEIVEPKFSYVTYEYLTYQEPSDIGKQVCRLLGKKIVTLCESIQTPEDFFAYRFPPDNPSLANCTLEDCEIFERVYGARMIPILDEVIQSHEQGEYLDGLVAIRERLEVYR